MKLHRRIWLKRKNERRRIYVVVKSKMTKYLSVLCSYIYVPYIIMYLPSLSLSFLFWYLPPTILSLTHLSMLPVLPLEEEK
jgi:hypothetical protein